MIGIPVRGLVVLGVLALAGLLYVANDGQPMGSASQACEVTVTADVLNVRAGPADTQPIVATMRRDAVVAADKKVENGFRLLADGRWVKDQFVAPTSDSDCG